MLRRTTLAHAVLITRLRIDGQEFHLPPDVDVPALQQQIIEAAAGRPAFVTFRPLGYGEMSVLVSTHITVRFEVEEISEDQYAAWRDQPPSIDVFPEMH